MVDESEQSTRVQSLSQFSVLVFCFSVSVVSVCVCVCVCVCEMHYLQIVLMPEFIFLYILNAMF